MEERRKFPRLDLSVDVNWEKIPTKSKKRLAKSKNISQGGIRLIADNAIKIGDSLDLQIKLPTNQTISSVGRVAWVNEFEVIGGKYEKRYDTGIEFTKIKKKDVEELKNFMFSFLPASK